MEKAHNHQYIDVGIGQERYAIQIQDIHEIIKLQDITELPNSKPYMKGVINLRGIIVPIICLRMRFGMNEAPYTKSTRIVVVNHMDEMIGIVVDRVNQVTTLTEIQPPPERIGNVQSSYFTGISSTDDGLVSVLKLEQVLQE